MPYARPENAEVGNLRTRPDQIRIVELSSGSFEIDEAGYLVDPTAWTPEFARHVAENEGIELGDLHLQVIDFMREYLTENGVAADVRHVTGFLAKQAELDKRDAKSKFYELFPAGHVQQTCKVSGMRQPRAWSTG